MSASTPSSLDRELHARLQQRRAELQQLLAAQATAAELPEVVDFKDIADEDARAAIGDVARLHAVRELTDISAALRRMAAGSYGSCESCGEPIDQDRLRALPATALCRACQADRERAAALR